MDTNGWCDVAYSYLLFQPRGFFRRPRVFEGRTFAVVPASQAGHNTGNGSVCVVMGPGDRLKRGTIRKLRGIARRFPGHKVRGHRDVSATECPGDLLYSHVAELDKLARGPKKMPLP
jgi:hypothetical protein